MCALIAGTWQLHAEMAQRFPGEQTAITWITSNIEIGSPRKCTVFATDHTGARCGGTRTGLFGCRPADDRSWLLPFSLSSRERLKHEHLVVVTNRIAQRSCDRRCGRR